MPPTLPRSSSLPPISLSDTPQPYTIKPSSWCQSSFFAISAGREKPTFVPHYCSQDLLSFEKEIELGLVLCQRLSQTLQLFMDELLDWVKAPAHPRSSRYPGCQGQTGTKQKIPPSSTTLQSRALFTCLPTATHPTEVAKTNDSS